ncbi:hypothetical protein BpHYR1_046361 [Brachionus plicatilis]|uniref:Uncharacterized protein n=1 Tax=Brachionus plicatilis TaxID=10195 RepID=A0A3M7RG48_BRAPC|nr:hypothetical protein BpHYR1_046361 [Brachionus plicatilis]
MSILVPIEKLFDSWKVEELKGVLLAQARCLGASYLVSDNDELKEVSEETFNGWIEEVTSSQGAKKVHLIDLLIRLGTLTVSNVNRVINIETELRTNQKEFKEREEELRTMAEELNELKKLNLSVTETGNHESKLSPPSAGKSQAANLGINEADLPMAVIPFL